MNDKIIFGCAYYEEYLPYDRLLKDMDMMYECGINTIRIAESTWSVLEPLPGQFDFSHIDRVIKTAREKGIDVIVGTPTYALPQWLTELDADILAVTSHGKNLFGARQNYDITNKTFRKYAERMIKTLIEHVKDYPNVIGFQLDNETKHYDTSGESVQKEFAHFLKEKFKTTDNLNKAFGLDYWSNSVFDFDKLPDINGTINASLSCEFEKFKRKFAADFLAWQADIVRPLCREGQFLTQNFDFDWKTFGAPGTQDGYSHGLQPGICHYDASKAFDIAGTDVYHFTQDALTGMEISFAGSEIYALKNKNYLVLETQAQGFKEWVPYPGQLKAQAYMHIASGASGIMYWHWHSIHNSKETYWKGILSHDFSKNPVYDECGVISNELKKAGDKLTGLEKHNKVALMVNNESLSLLSCFPTDKDFSYNDLLVSVYRALYNINCECDIIYSHSDWQSGNYKCIITPMLYSVSGETTDKLKEFVNGGGTLITLPRSFFSDTNGKVFCDSQPHGLTSVFGVTYNQFTKPVNVTVNGEKAEYWMELLKPITAKTLYKYNHKHWGEYSAVTENTYGKGRAYYIGCILSTDALQKLFADMLKAADVELPDCEFPLIIKTCKKDGRTVRFYFNFSDEKENVITIGGGRDVLYGARYKYKENITLPEWGVTIVEEDSLC